MALLTADRPIATRSPIRLLAARLVSSWNAYSAYRTQRVVYLRTLQELRSYRPHELHDLRILPDDFEKVARQQAGW
jgi:uncharacterized protein YjiS (DUF1127 family)